MSAHGKVPENALAVPCLFCHQSAGSPCKRLWWEPSSNSLEFVHRTRQHTADIQFYIRFNEELGLPVDHLVGLIGKVMDYRVKDFEDIEARLLAIPIEKTLERTEKCYDNLLTPLFCNSPKSNAEFTLDILKSRPRPIGICTEFNDGYIKYRINRILGTDENQS